MANRPGLTGTPAPRPEGTAGGGLTDARALNRLLVALAIAGMLLLAADPLVEKHPYFEIEYLPGFYGIAGALATALAVLVVALLRPLVRRPEVDDAR